MSKINSCVLILALVCFIGCSNDNEEAPAPINRDFKKFVDSFWLEATARGISIDTSNLEIVMVERITSQIGDFCGKGYFNFEGTGINRVEISENSFCWEDRTDIERENLMFHELGHAILGRFHLDDILPNGSSRSLMCSNCSNFDTYGEFTMYKKPYYLDELFDQTTFNPEWANAKTVRSTIFSDNFDDGQLEWEFVTSDGASNRNGYVGRLVSNSSTSSPNSLSISAGAIEDINASAYWTLTIEDPNIPRYSNIFLDYKFRSLGVQGEGASMSILGYDASRELVFFTTTDGNIDFSGTRDFTFYQMGNHCYPDNVDVIEIRFALHPNTIGQIFIDDVELEIHK